MQAVSDLVSGFQTLGIPESLLSRIEQLGFREPTPVQMQAIPAGLASKDLVVQAKTGSGKTLAYGIPLLARVMEQPSRHSTVALVLVPTRELAQQVVTVFEQVEPQLAPVCVIGGVSIGLQREQMGRDPRVVVGTPGRILDLIERRELLLRKIQFVVLDEADEMLSMGFIEDVERILRKLPDNYQGIFTSATITPRVEMLARSYLTDAERICISTPGEEHAPIDHSFMFVDGEIASKAKTLCDLLDVEQPESLIIFCNTKSDTELVEVFLKRRGYLARRINSDLSQNERTEVINLIKSGELPILIGTDIAARGLDIAGLDLVVHYGVPEDPDLYVHRSGRTGRAGRRGRAILFVTPQDFTSFQTLKRDPRVKLEEMKLPSPQERMQKLTAQVVQQLSTSLDPASEREQLVAQALLEQYERDEISSADFHQLFAKLLRRGLERRPVVSEGAPDAEGGTPLDQNAGGSRTSSDRYRERGGRGRSSGRSGRGRRRER